MSKEDNLLSALKALREASSRIAHHIEFDSQDDAIKHAQKLASLVPGDIVFDEEVKCVFLKWDKDSHRAVLLYYDDDHNISGKAVPPGCISFEPRTIAEDDD